MSTGAALAVTAVPVALASAAVADPMCAAIDANKAVTAAWDTAGNRSDDESDRLGDAGQEAWERMLKTTPTTVAGLLAFMQYAREYGSTEVSAFLPLTEEDGTLEAWQAVERMIRDLA